MHCQLPWLPSAAESNVVYVWFVVTFCMINPTVYYYTTILSGLFTETPISSTNDKTFRQIAKPSDFWEVSG